MTDSEFKYWAFLSYSQQDNCEQRPDSLGASHLCWGNWLHDTLKTFSVPADFAGHPNSRGEIVPERIAPIFQDEQEQPENAGLSAEVRQALEQSRWLVVVCSPRSAKSLHVNEAVRCFKQLGRGDRILPIVVAGVPHASDGSKPGISPDDECFVPAMRHPVKPDGTLDTTRRERGYIFADARHGAEKREILTTDLRIADTELAIAQIQLIAGLIGVGFNGLWRREQKRRFTGYVEAQHQAREAQNKVLETQHQFQEARKQAQDAQNQLQTIQNQAREALNQLEEARNQVREAQNKVLEVQNLPQDVHSQIQEAQNKAREAEDQARAAQSQLQEFQNKARETQSQLEEARHQVGAAESKVIEAQNQARDAQSQLEQARYQVREAQNKVLETQNLSQEVRSQIQEAQNQTLEAQNQARDAQSQIAEARHQAREAESKVLEAQQQAREAQDKIREIQNQARNEQQPHIQGTPTEPRGSQRLTKVLAVMAVLALLAAGIAASVALRQRKAANQALARAASAEAGKFNLVEGGLSPEQIRQALQKFGGAEQDANRLRSLDELATRLPTNEIPETLKASSVIFGDRQRSHFQKELLLRLGAISPLSAMTNASAIEGKIVNADGVSESPLDLQLAVLDDWMKVDLPAAFDWAVQLPDTDSRQRALQEIIPALPADNFTNTLARLNELKPAPGEPVYTQLFQRWATNNPVQAIDQRQQLPDQNTNGKMLRVIMTAWMAHQPDAVWDWVKSQPDSAFKNKALAIYIEEQATTDISKALALTESLPDSVWRDTMIVGLFKGWTTNDLEASTTACQQLPDGAAKNASWQFVLNQRIAQDPASAAEDVKNLGPSDYRQKAITELCQHWADTNAPAALAWAQNLSGEAEQMAVTNQIVASWAHQYPQAAAQFADQHPELTNAVFSAIAAAWARTDWSATTNWVESLPVGEKKDATLSALSETWAQNDPKGMATYALSLPAGEVQTNYLTTACCKLAVHDLPESVEVLQPLSDAALKQSILEQAAGNCDLLQMNQAAKYVADMPAGDDRKALIRGLLSKWTPADPESALTWLISFPNTNAQPEQVQSIIKAWSQREPAAAAKWLATLPAGTNSDEIASNFLESAVAKYPEFAAQWTQSLTNETQRQQFQIQVAQQWLKTNPTGASNWINTLELPDDIKESLKASTP